MRCWLSDNSCFVVLFSLYFLCCAVSDGWFIFCKFFCDLFCKFFGFYLFPFSSSVLLQLFKVRVVSDRL